VIENMGREAAEIDAEMPIGSAVRSSASSASEEAFTGYSMEPSPFFGDRIQEDNSG
jgi:hypothetical protein